MPERRDENVPPVLASGRLPATAHQLLERELAQDDGMQRYPQALLSERANAIDFFRNSGWDRWPIRAYFNDDECYTLDFLNEQIGHLSRPFSESLVSAQPFQQPTRFLRPISKLLIPAVLKANEAVLSHEGTVAPLCAC